MKKENIESIGLLDNIKEVGLFYKLKLFEKIPPEALPTDLALLTGAQKDELGYTMYWTNTCGYYHIAVIASKAISRDRHYEVTRDVNAVAIRPKLNVDTVPNDIDIIEFGEYPMFVENNPHIIDALNDLKDKNSTTNLTGKTYTLDGKNKTPEYEFNGIKYVPVKAVSDEILLGNGAVTQKDKTYWVKVEPVYWYVDHQTNTLVSQYALLGGIPYFKEEDVEPAVDMNGDVLRASSLEEQRTKMYSESFMKSFLNSSMLPDISKISKVKSITKPPVKNGIDYTSVVNVVEPLMVANNKFGIDHQIVRMLTDIKELLSSEEISDIDKQLIKETINRKKQIDKLKDGPFKEKLNKVLYLDLIDLKETLKDGGLEFPSNKQERYDKFNLKVNELLEAIKIRSKTVNLDLMKTYLNVIIKRVNDIIYINGGKRFSIICWRYVEQFIDMMVDALVLDDNELFDALEAFDLNNPNNFIWDFMFNTQVEGQTSVK